MLFHTWPFLLFLLVVLPVFYALGKTRLWLVWMLAASYVFYGWWNPWYLALVLYTTTLVYFVVTMMDRCPAEEPSGDVMGRLMRLRFDDRMTKAAFIGCALAAAGLAVMALGGPTALRPMMIALGVVALLLAAGALFSHREVWLWIGVLNTLAPLLFFKYARFTAENLNAVLSWLHLPATLADPATLMPSGCAYLLPIGISFFTFQSLGYVIDVYLGKTERERNFLRFANFACFFPVLMSGPIERAGHLLPQFQRFPGVRLQNFTDGASLILSGLFKKLVLANYLALYVDRVYENPQAFGAPALLLATVTFAWQLYFDFSGYTDMARGVGRFLGIDLMLNFNHPYLATGIGDFWRCWHISFSRWILDYIFMPLQMQWREARAFGTAAALVVTFLVSGIWHGAAWTFIIWGALHGLGLALTYELERSAFYRKRVPAPVKQVGVFAFICFTWIFFRANTLPDAFLIVRRIFTAAWENPQVPGLMLALVALVWVYHAVVESKFRSALQVPVVRVGMAVLMALTLFLCASGGGAFFYFQF